jgi:hypothetical protein
MKKLLVPILIGVAIFCGAAMALPELFNSGVSRDTSAKLAEYFTDAAAALKKIVVAPPGYTERSQAFHQAWAAERIMQVNRAINALKGQSSGWVATNVPLAYRTGLKLASTQAVAAGVSKDAAPIKATFNLVDTRAVQKFAQDTVGDCYKAADSMGDRAGTVLRQTAQLQLPEASINKILAGGLIEGKPVQTIRNLREEMRRVYGEVVQVGKVNLPVNYYAEMVARTKTREAVVTAKHERLQEMNLDLVAIVGRISKNFCTAFLGQVFSLSGASDKYPAYSDLRDGGPPFHPNCSKSTRPFIEELANAKQIAMAQTTADTDKLMEMKPSSAQRTYKDLNLYAQVKDRYATTAAKLFG